MGAPVLSVQKCGSFHLECPKCGSTRVKHSKVGELSFETTRSVGALELTLKSSITVSITGGSYERIVTLRGELQDNSHFKDGAPGKSVSSA